MAKIVPWGEGGHLWAREYCDKALSVFWLWTEIQMEGDIADYKTKLNPTEKEIIKDILKTFTQTEMFVEEYWTQKVAPMFKAYPEIVQAAITMGSFEVIHIRSYAYLNEVLGLEDEFSKFLDVTEFNNKMMAINNSLSEVEPDDQLVLFSAFIEGVALYSSFLVLGSFQFRNLMKGVGRIIEFSIRDENLHHEFGVELALRTYEDEVKPRLAHKFAKMIYDLELESINYIFRNGDLENLRREHVVNYIQNRINEVLAKLGFGPMFDNVSQTLLEEISWFNVLTSGLKQSDFFAGRETGYKKWEVVDTELWG
jgi:ribonucleoside-diphosphate reductase beta chain